jgi:hypothetical protein
MAPTVRAAGRGTSRRSSRGRGVFAAALLVSAAALCGCRLGEKAQDPMAQGQVVLGKGGVPAVDRGSSEVHAAAERALASAEAAWQAGDSLTAIAILNQALVRGVPPDLESRVRELRVRARAAVVTDKVVRIRAVPVKDVVSDGEPVPVRIVVHNLSAATLRAPRREGGSSDALFVVSVVREDHDVYGNVKTSEFTVRAPLSDDLEVPAGGEREVHVSIDPDLVALRHEGLSVFRVGGTFRPVAVRVGESEFFDALPIEPATVRVLQKGYEQLAQDPLASLRKAVARRSPPHVLAAAELVPATQRDEARSALRDAAERDDGLAFCLRAALARLDALDQPPAQKGARP